MPVTWLTCLESPGRMSVLGDGTEMVRAEIGIDKDGNVGPSTTMEMEYGIPVIDKLDYFGTLGWTPVVGNWNGDATGDKIGVYMDGVWYLDNDGSGTWNAGDQG